MPAKEVTSYTPVPWYGRERYLGLHVDFHAGPNDTELGTGAAPAVLAEQLKRMDVDFVQIDTKGGPGYTSYFARNPTAQVCPVLKVDLVKAWREATRRVGIPLHAHWIAVSDEGLCRRKPDWRRVDESGRPDEKHLCYRSPFVDECMIPQLLELIGDWGLDGVWIDGQAWAVGPCWCSRCVGAWKAGGETSPPPTTPDDPAWSRWMSFHRRGFDDYVNHYADALHARFPQCRICDNWSLTLSQPGQPKLHVDFISSDDAAPFGLDNIRLEARFTSSRGLPWDFMQWLFYAGKVMHDPTIPQAVRPLEQIQQEAAYILALGGGHQIYEQPSPKRDGGLIDWRVDRIAAVHCWCRQRGELCRGSEPWEDVAILNSEHHFERHATGSNLLWSFDQQGLRGAVNAVTAAHRGVDILDEWALAPRLERFSVLVIPEQPDISDGLVSSVKSWVRSGGRLLLSGASMPEKWGADFLGVEAGPISGKASWHVPVEAGARVPIWSETWRLVEPRGAAALGFLSRSDELERGLTPHPAATVHRFGQGAVAWIPCNAFAFFERTRYALLRQFFCGVLDALGGPPPVRVSAPLAIEVILRKQGARRVVHLINRGSGWSTGPNDFAVEAIPPAGPVTIEIGLPTPPPKEVEAAWENGNIAWTWADGTARIVLDRVRIHEAVVLGE